MSAVVTASLFPDDVGRQHEEDDLQRTVVRFLRVSLPPDACVFHVPNGGLRSKKEAGRMQGLGVLAGVPDLLILWRGRALFVELKAKRGVLSAQQRTMHQLLVYCGCEVLVARSLDAVADWLRSFQMPLRGRVQ